MAAAAVVAALITGWPAAAPIAALATWGVPKVLRETRATASVATMEAVAVWTEMLHGTLAASAGLGQALVATADLGPAALRPALQRLAAQVGVGVPPGEALLEFADTVDDPSADRVVCSLLLAFSSRAQRLGELLAALAASTRDEVALQLRVETSRASVRSSVRTVVLFSLAFAGLLVLLARSYLAPFATPVGQVVLLLVAGLYAGAIALMVVLSRPPRAVRLLDAREEQR
jgi:Flp pilus assembly protein TadB